MHISMTKGMPKEMSTFGLKWSINMKGQDISTSFVFMHTLNNCVFRVGILWLPDSEIITSLSYSWIISCSDLALPEMLWIYRLLTWCGAAVKISLWLCYYSPFQTTTLIFLSVLAPIHLGKTGKHYSNQILVFSIFFEIEAITLFSFLRSCVPHPCSYTVVS